ncbi:MAG: hypothetical protein A2Y07_00740 [Planctomycetes bacterium GWF2_50_10]|nr:MAG: hypothetical protein A2Y07_00740 [Planctomycetes bacterium GWF2_50_10]
MYKMATYTVIIPVCNAGEAFGRSLEAFEFLTAKCDILIIDSSPVQKQVELPIQTNLRVHRINHADFNHGATRNLGARLAQSDILVFFTQDSVCADENTIAELVRPLIGDPAIAVSYGRQIPKPSADPIEAFNRNFNYPSESRLKTKADLPVLGIKTYFCSNSCAAYRRYIFDKLGGFQEGVGTNEDMLFAAKAINAGYGVYYAAQARVFHSHDYTAALLWKRYFQIGKFFAQNKWLLESAPAAGEARKVLIAGITHFLKRKMYFTCFRFVCEALIKGIACRMGMLLAPKRAILEKNADFSMKKAI